MQRITGTVLVALALTCGLGACTDSDGKPETKATTTTINPKVQAQKDASAAQAAACTTDYRTIETALEAYRAAEDKEPVSVRVLVPRYLKKASPSWKVVLKGGKASIALSDGGKKVHCKIPT